MNGSEETLRGVMSAVGLGGWGDGTQGEKKRAGTCGSGDSLSKGTRQDTFRDCYALEEENSQFQPSASAPSFQYFT